jgi:two-component system sensor histidine kinase EvgS
LSLSSNRRLPRARGRRAAGHARAFGRRAAAWFAALACLLFAGWAAAADGFVVGTVPGPDAPLDMNVSPGGTSGRGISADYAAEVARALGLRLEWRLFRDRRAMIAALERGEIDAATSATGEDDGAPLLLSQPYLPTQQVYVEPAAKRAAVGVVTYVENQTSPARLHAAYPNLTPVAYRTAVGGLLAVALGEADAFVGDLTTTAFIIGQYDLISVVISGYAPFDEGGYSFAFSPAHHGAAQLRERVDAALDGLPANFRSESRVRWGATASNLVFRSPLVLTDAERAWIGAHPVVRYSMFEGSAPFAFRDASGEPAGLAVDVLNTIARTTGLRFEGRLRRSIDDVYKDLNDGEASLIPFSITLGQTSPERVPTVPYGEALLAIVTRTDAPPLRRGTSLAGKRVALPAGYPTQELVRLRSPQAQIVDVPPIDGQFQAVAGGKADATVIDMAYANYAVGNTYRGKLQITGALSADPVPHGFLVAAKEPVLLGIMNRAIEHIHPAELDAIRRRWVLVQHPEPLWERRRPQVELGASLGVAVLLLLAGWAVSLRTQINRRIAAETAMRAAKEEAETANRAKSTFLATMSHEIRTPMNAVLGLIELELRAPGDRAATKRALTTAHGAARDLLGMIDDLLDVAKIEAERLVLAPEPLEVDAWVAGVVAIYEPAAHTRGIALEVKRRGEDGPAWILADGQRLRQVVGNLLSNAIKFTEAGSVTLAYEVGRASNGMRDVVLEVSDTGLGVPLDKQAALFAPFVQAHEDRSGRFGGTGLGLTICRRLVTMMGGTIDLVSEPGHGATFTVRLSLPGAEPVDAARFEPSGTRAPDGELAGLHVLIVDDHPANRIVLEGQIVQFGCTAQQAGDGRAALAKWREHPDAFDLIVTDCSMPEMSGEELTRAIRALENDVAETGGPRPRVPIVGLTANAHPEALQAAVAAGMDLCLVKPLGLDELRRALLGVGLARKPAGAQPDTRKPVSPRPAGQAAAASERAFDPAIVAGFGAQADVLVGTLRSENARDLDDARNAHEACDYARLRATAHRMKGAAAVIGAARFSAACLALQTTCDRALDEDRNGEDDDTIAAAFEVVIREGTALSEALALAQRAA